LCLKCLSEMEPEKVGFRCKPCRKTRGRKRLEYKKQWNLRNPDKLRQYEKTWRLKNHDKVQVMQKRYYQTHREQRKELVRGWLERHPFQARVYRNRYRARMAESHGDHTAAEVRAVVAKFKGKCAICGSTDRIEIDHYVAVSKGGCNFAYNLRPLCFKHNREKNASLNDVAQFSLFDKVQK